MNWDENPNRQLIRSESPDVPRRITKKKNTNLWCKGVVGREHKPVIKIKTRFGNDACGYAGWSFGSGKSKWYFCYHVKLCSACGKILRYSVPCPDKNKGGLKP